MKKMSTSVDKAFTWHSAVRGPVDFFYPQVINILRPMNCRGFRAFSERNIGRSGHSIFNAEADLLMTGHYAKLRAQ
jgi:hypothetical protein